MSDAIHDCYRRIGRALVENVQELLLQGEHVALLGPRQGGKSLILTELQYRVSLLPEMDRPRVLYLSGQDSHIHTVEDFITTFAGKSGGAYRGPIPDGTRISGVLYDVIRGAVRTDRHPLWIFVKDLLDVPTSLVRGLLEALQTSHEDHDLRGRVSAAITGGLDFVPLTYGEVSPYRHAHRFLLLGFEHRHAGLFFARRRICQRGGSKVPERAGFEEVDVSDEIDGDALDFLYEQTGGNAHLIQQIVVRIPGYPRPPGIEDIGRRWTLPETRVFVEHFLQVHMPEDFYVRLAVRDVKRDPLAFDLLTRILHEGNGTVRIDDPRPHTLELTGLAYRDGYGRASIACPLWQEYMHSVLDACHVADTYACQRRWEKAWPAYAAVVGTSRDRPPAGDAADRLREVLVEWEDSFVDRIADGPDAVCRRFFQGAYHLLGCDAGGIYDSSKSPPTAYYNDPAILEQGKPYFPTPQDKCCGAEASTKYWLDASRQRLFSDCEAELPSPLRVRPVLCLQRFGIDRPIDAAAQKHLVQILHRFWIAYFRAHEMQYAKGVGALRDRHLKVIARVNAMLVEEAFDMGELVDETAKALVEDAGYYRVQICLVDAKGENIEAISGHCIEPGNRIDFPSNFPLDSENPVDEWDIQPWVVRKGEMCVVEDASSPSQRNPTTQWQNSVRLGMKAITIVPIKIGNRVLGTIHFERLDKSVPSLEERELFRIFSSQLAVAFYYGQRFTLLQESVHQLRDEVRILDPWGRSVFLNRPAAQRQPAHSAGWQAEAVLPPLTGSGTPNGKTDRLLAQVESSAEPGRRYHFVREGAPVRASERLIAPVEDFRSKLLAPYAPAHGRIGYVERIHDVTELYELYESLQAWLREKELRDTAAKILQFFQRKKYRWCRLYLRQTEPNEADVLVSFQEFGLTKPLNRAAFRRGDIHFFRNAKNPQPWHMIEEVGGPAIYELDPKIEEYVRPTEDWNGFPRYLVQSVPYENELERENVARWIEAPLLLGHEIIGKFSLSVNDDLRAEQWELLKSTILGIAVALHNARRMKSEANRIAEETWQMAAAQAVHQLGNKLSPALAWLHFALKDLTSNPAEAFADLSRVHRNIESAVTILNDFRRYASEKPFEDTRRFEIAGLLRQTFDAVRERHPDIGSLDLALPVPDVAVEVSLEALVEVFEILVDNSLRHSNLAPSILQIHLAVEVVSDDRSRILGGVPAVRLVYTDNGVGIPRQDRETIFEPFHSTHQEGTGLGLTIARRYVRRHRGELVVGDRSGPGACFLVYIPTVR